MNHIGQGTIEYLVILAVVVVVSLGVVTVMVGSTGNTNTQSQAARLEAQSAPIAIEDGIESPSKLISIKLKNNTGENITINSINVGDASSTGIDYYLTINDSKLFALIPSVACIEGTVNFYDVIINYTSSTNLEKTQNYGLPYPFPCEYYGGVSLPSGGEITLDGGSDGGTMVVWNGTDWVTTGSGVTISTTGLILGNTGAGITASGGDLTFSGGN